MSPDLTRSARLEALKELIETDREDRHFFVDFDHTLLLGNSTDLFINSAEPRILFWTLMKGLGLLRPWIFMPRGGKLLWRDPMRVRVIRYLYGKRLVESFRKNAGSLWQQFKNDELCDLICQVSPSNVTIVSFGIDEVIETLLKGTALEGINVVAPCAVSMTKERRKGKLGMLRERGIFINANRDVVITDSKEDDADLLERVDQGFHIEWHR